MNSTTSFYAQALPQLHSAYQKMNLYLTIFVLFPGWFLNFFMAAIFAQKKFWRESETKMGYTYTLLAIFSNLAITIGILNFFPAAFGRDLTILGGVDICRLIWFLRLFFVPFSQYFQAQMTVLRAISIVYPRRFLWLNKTPNLLKITALVMLFNASYALLQVFRYYVYQETVYNNKTVLVPVSCILSPVMTSAYNISYFVVRLSGFVVYFIADIFIIRKLFISKLTINQSSGSGLSNREFSFALSILWGNVLHIALVIPFLVILGIQLAPGYKSNKSTDYIAYVNQLYAIMNWGNYIYEAMPFYINVASNRVFRSELIKLWNRRRGSVTSETRRINIKSTTTRSPDPGPI